MPNIDKLFITTEYSGLINSGKIPVAITLPSTSIPSFGSDLFEKSVSTGGYEYVFIAGMFNSSTDPSYWVALESSGVFAMAYGGGLVYVIVSFEYDNSSVTLSVAIINDSSSSFNPSSVTVKANFALYNKKF